MLVTMGELLKEAQKGKYAVCAPSNKDEITLRASIDAAEETRSPVIINLNYRAHPDIKFFARMCRDLALEATVPVALNQDHGACYDHAMCAIQAGFTSVMADRSTLPFEDNVAQVAEIVKVAHACGVTVEGELGHVGYSDKDDEDQRALTVPSEAKEYVKQTGVDCLAVAIGTIHGAYKGTPYIDFDLLHELTEAVDIPLVLHGGSGSGDENLARACREGICKVNIGTDVMQKGRDAVLNSTVHAPHDTLPFFYEAYKEELKRYMVMFGSAGKV
ncbi:class II fructose-bisphosphate aldolase [Enterococcus pallens]|uniref:Ketose-bisphosphate aldolase n=1 Tax=Enterococcus pallens ATCC BAA-351 TaxID=1158607 RepID=R2QK58_9ENTE|nr:class II fructose-bisphosphate aldolase [Enterococcus pallens]EOH95568.1 ketose-bisphosphate aldolase [Enterococcus pallens ATCC BAA-351]EOU21295.1 hypothetical protein I588_02142 [Enterococcus pallens ATCC BAA-351]OJG78816.1 ketose-bisphosphate aldolase [Enterococcus pallens]